MNCDSRTGHTCSTKMNSLLKIYRLASARGAAVSIRPNAMRWMPSTVRCFSDDTKNEKPALWTANKFVPISEDTATIILDVEEEREKLNRGDAITDTEIIGTETDQYSGLNTKRGIRGVFDIEELVEVLQRDNANDIFVCEVPRQLKYVDYICVVTARSPRHMKAIAEFVRKMYKMKRAKTDLVPRLEGKGSEDWFALDLGNIALHILSIEARQKYDIEQLWSVGAEFDAETNKPDDEAVQMYERHSRYLSDLIPATTYRSSQESSRDPSK